jgi:hypothetical protein
MFWRSVGGRSPRLQPAITESSEPRKQTGEAPYARLEQQRGGRARTRQSIKYYNSTNIYYININTDDNNWNNREHVEPAVVMLTGGCC